MQTLNWKVMALSLALFSGFSFILCVAWGLLVPPGVHGTRFLEMTLPGFVWLTPGTFVLGHGRGDQDATILSGPRTAPAGKLRMRSTKLCVT